MRRGAALPVVVLSVVASLSSSPVPAGEKGRCLRADVPAPFVLPDDTVHPAGTLTLCVTDYSPVASYHRVLVNGAPVGMLFSQRRVPEDKPAKEPVVLFRRNDAGELRLLGYIWPIADKSHAYVLQGEPWDARSQNRVPAQELAAPEPSEPAPSPGG